MSIKTTNNIKDYVDDFFDNLELYDDYKNNHDYKGILKSSIDVFLNYNAVNLIFSICLILVIINILLIYCLYMVFIFLYF